MPTITQQLLLSPSRYNCLEFATGSCLSITVSISVKIAVLAPIPKVRVSTTTAVNTGFLRSTRTPNRKSRHNVSTKDSQRADQTISFVTSRLPRSKRTARSASLGLIPCFTFSSTAISRKPFSSSSRSWLTCSFRNSARSPSAMFRSTDMAVLYDASRILAIAATCLVHSRVSDSSLLRPRSVSE